MESKNEFYLLAVVAIVAIVGIVVLIMGANKAPVATSYTSDVLGEDMTGQAYAIDCRTCMQRCAYGGYPFYICASSCQYYGSCANGAGSG